MLEASSLEREASARRTPNLCEVIEARDAELEAGGIWHQWDEGTYCKRKRLAVRQIQM
jgi:hypothetical protein